MRKLLVAALVVCMGLSTGTASAERSGGTLNFMAPYGGDLFGLDPHKSTRYQDLLVAMNIHRSLYKWDAEKNEAVPELAESVRVSDDGLVYTFTLRPDIKFHHGRQLTSDDVIYSYNRIATMQPASPQLPKIIPIQGVQAVVDGKADRIAGLKKIDDLNFEMTLADPVDIKFYLWLPGTDILPGDEIERLGDAFSTNPVGCGPFKFVRWVKGSEIILEKFADFYIQDRPFLDKVVYKIMSEAAPRDLAFKARELDANIVGSVNYPEYQADPVISQNLIEVAEMFTRVIGFNPDFKPFSDKRVRQAISYAIPADLIIDKILKGKAFPARGYLPTTSPAFNPEIKRYDLNIEKAKQLMKEAGYENGFVVEKAIGTANESWGTVIYEAAMPYLRQIGVTIKIEQMEGAAMAERIRSGEYQMFIWSLTSGPDPLEALARWKSVNPQAAGNHVKYNNPEFDRYLDLAAATRDNAEKIALIQKAEAIFVEDAPLWFFNYNKAILAHHPWVHNLAAVAPEMMFQDLTHVWVDETSPRATVK